MPEMTQHIGLKKPLESETADISVINDNMDMIDSALGDLSAVPTAAKDAAGAITELFEGLENADIPDATLTTKGKVQLSSATNSTAEDQAATPKAVKSAIDTHVADYIRHPGYGMTAGTANTYTLTLTPALAEYVAGVCIAVKINVANTGPSTINVNGLGSRLIYDSKGNALTAGKLKQDIIYTLRFNGSAFILQGEGGGGNATAAQILAGRTATVDSGEIIGAMPDYSNLQAGNGYAVATSAKADSGGNLVFEVPTGYYKSGLNSIGYGNVIANDSDFVAYNFRADKNMFGLQGTMPVRGNEEYSGWRRLSLAPFGAGTGRAHFAAPVGAYLQENVGQAGVGNTGFFVDDPNFIEANILEDVSIFGLQGTLKRGKKSAMVSKPAWSTTFPISGIDFVPSLVFVVFPGYYTVGNTSNSQSGVIINSTSYITKYVSSSTTLKANILNANGTACDITISVGNASFYVSGSGTIYLFE